MKDKIGDRLKELYEIPETSRCALQTDPIYIRIDGKSFSRFTEGFNRPFDTAFSDVMIATTRRLIKETGAILGYTQSDEISLAWSNKELYSDHIFGGKYQKMCSILAGIATSEFTLRGLELFPNAIHRRPPVFDTRVFSLPDLMETANCFVWRCLDARKNSISQLARHHFRARDMHQKNGLEMIQMLRDKGIEWEQLESRFRYGTFIRPESQEVLMPLEQYEAIPEKHRPPTRQVVRTVLVESSFDYSMHEDKVGFLIGSDI